MGNERQTARLLIFTLGPRHERQRRRLLPARLGGWEGALHRRCLDSAVEAGRRSGLEVVVSSPGEVELPAGTSHIRQEGSGFGERFAGALAAVEDRPVVAVGTDVPGLSADHIAWALARLADDPERVVIGPSPDGGCYLVAASRPVAHLLAEVRWCRRGTLKSLLATLAGAGRPVELLPALADLDRRSDLDRWLAGGEIRPALCRLAARLTELLAGLRRPLVPFAVRAQVRLAPVRPSGRAPPRRRRPAL